MAKKEYHFEPTEGATPFSVIPSEFMTLGKQHIHECVKAHSELLDRVQEATRSWLEYLRSEADLSAEFTSRMIAARSSPSAATVLLEWTGRHMELATADAQHLLADTKRIVEIGVRLLPGGWLLNGKARGNSPSPATPGFPSPVSSPSPTRPDSSAPPTAAL
jgi:hypothetical protein